MELNIFANRKEAATKKKRRTANEIDKSFTVNSTEILINN